LRWKNYCDGGDKLRSHLAWVQGTRRSGGSYSSSKGRRSNQDQGIYRVVWFEVSNGVDETLSSSRGHFLGDSANGYRIVSGYLD